jgi:hypothetical protein
MVQAKLEVGASNSPPQQMFHHESNNGPLNSPLRAFMASIVCIAGSKLEPQRSQALGQGL